LQDRRACLESSMARSSPAVAFVSSPAPSLARLAAIALLTGSSAFGQSEAPAAVPPPRDDAAMRHAAAGQYLAAIAELERRAERKPADPLLWNELATYRSFVGDSEGARLAMERTGKPARGDPPSAALAAELAASSAVDALDEIVRLAADRQVVILNEAHHVPEHRAFALRLAERLRPLGFEWLACETFTPETVELTRRGVPTRATGYNSNEPLFGGFLRVALALGYRPVAYEIDASVIDGGADVIDRIRAREIAQSDHLVERLFAANPRAKLLIYCGYSHATEDWSREADGRETAWMAARLAKRLGIDPLTIDQTEQTPGGAPEGASAAWSFVAQRAGIAAPLVLQRRDGSCVVDGSGWRGRVDLQVFHPATTLIDGRPAWMHGVGGRLPVEVPAELEPSDGRRMIVARPENEPEEAVPLDRIVLTAGEPCPVLLLPPGRYRVSAFDEQGRACGAEEVEVTP
jgi:hypothetical protein